MLLFGLLIVITIGGIFGYLPLRFLFSTTAAPTNTPIDVARGEQTHPSALPQHAVDPQVVRPTATPQLEQPTTLKAEDSEDSKKAIPSSNMPLIEQPITPGTADGVVPNGTTIFDDQLPSIKKLDPALLRAMRQAATDAADDGITFFVTSGWRSPDYQNQLLNDAILIYGSEEVAAQWVATADKSPHVAGAAIDIGEFDAIAWLSERGANYGLCQIYSNEPWHYELRPMAIDDGCPPMYPDPTHDPRMQR